MTPFERIQRAVDFIETHLQAELNMAEISAAACYSSFHFQRLFRAISGLSVQGYVQRRLSRLHACCATACSVLDAALTYGYQSHEAFSRALWPLRHQPIGVPAAAGVLRVRPEWEFLPAVTPPDRQQGAEIRLHEPCLLIGKTGTTSLEADYYADISSNLSRI
ncbi:MAG: helix-turn-helix transcriptional regulator [Uliginosibacterium sp.]|nr:helix-turn-helix transcriptional regulator [Uliginosibacterium sp.]